MSDLLCAHGITAVHKSIPGPGLYRGNRPGWSAFRQSPGAPDGTQAPDGTTHGTQ